MALRGIFLAACCAARVASSWWSSESPKERRFREYTGPEVTDILPVEVEDCQRRWGERIVRLGQILQSEPISRVKHEARKLVEDFHGRDIRDVMVKPADTVVSPFRGDAAGLVAWLVGHDAEYPSDTGFVAKQWSKVRFQNVGITLTGTEALAQGNCYFEDSHRRETKLEHTMGFYRDEGLIRMNLLFFSWPFENETARRERGITMEMIEESQRNFVEGIPTIMRTGRRYAEHGAIRFVDNIFTPNQGQVLFKPPDVAHEPFRTDRRSIISYFYDFARRGWTRGAISNAAVILKGDSAWAMGIYSFWNEDGESFEAEFSIGYSREGYGAPRINFFMASVPSIPEEESWWRRRRREPCHGESSRGVSLTAIVKLQENWAEGIKQISASHAGRGDYRRCAREFVDRLYAYQVRPVLFKPADAVEGHAFRTSRQGAIAYFVGGDPNYPDDKGFALGGWQRIRFTNNDVLFSGDEAITMGHVSYSGSDGIWQTAQLTMGVSQGEGDDLRINMQHGTFPHRRPHGAEDLTEDCQGGGRECEITEREVQKALKDWGQRVVEIGRRHHYNRSEAVRLTSEFLDKLYAFSDGQVLFNALDGTNATRFRTTRRGVMSFFLGQDCAFERDKGFAVAEQWDSVSFRSEHYSMVGSAAHVCGTTVLCCDRKDRELELDFAMGFRRGPDGDPKIFLHDMARPYEEGAGSLGLALGGVHRTTEAMRSVTASVGSAFGNPSMLVALVAVPAVAIFFLYLACCGSAGKLGPVGGTSSSRTTYPSFPSDDRFQNGGRYENGYATAASLGYQDQGYPHSYAPVTHGRYPTRGAVPSTRAQAAYYGGRAAPSMPPRLYDMS